MRLNLKKAKAKNVPCDVFIYLPGIHRFFFVDDKNVDGRATTFYFEEDVLNHHLLHFNNDEIVMFVKD